MYLGSYLSVQRGWLSKNIWIFLSTLGLVQALSCLLAYNSGQRSKVLSAAEPLLIARHENLALQFLVVWFTIALIQMAAFFIKSRWLQSTSHAVTGLLLIIQAIIAFQLGHLGGELLPHF